jgi:hypothetical protein
MSGPLSSRQQYVEWVEDRVEDFKAALPREELLSLAEEAVDGLFDTSDGQYPLTEILLRDAVDALIFRRLGLPTYRQWLRTCQSDTDNCPPDWTDGEEEGAERSG